MGILSIFSLVWGIFAIIGMAVAVIPFLGALNYLNIPFAIFGLLFSVLALIVSSRELSVLESQSFRFGRKNRPLGKDQNTKIYLTIGPKLWDNKSIRLASIHSSVALHCACLPLCRG